MQINHIFIIDPFTSLKPGHDSSLALMKAALNRQQLVWQCKLDGIVWENNSLKAKVQSVQSSASGLISAGEVNEFNLSEKSKTIIWMRKDPPVDERYIQVCQLLRLSKVPVLNDPNSLMACDEKLLALEFPSLTPQTTITQNIAEIKALVKQKGKLIAKPIGAKAGEGILVLNDQDKNLSSLLELMTKSGKAKIILQEFLSEASIGDKRVFVCSGEPVGAILRVPKSDDYRANMAAGGSIAKTTITPQDMQICNQLKPRLLELGLHIVGLDIIGGKLTEINITSPTCLEEIAQLDGSDPAGKIIDWSQGLF